MSFFSIGNFDIGGISEERVKELIDKNNNTVVKEKIIAAAEDYDDTKIYPTKQVMERVEPVGREDVLYIITDEDNTRYIWDKQGQKYSPIEGRIDNSQISDLFNS